LAFSLARQRQDQIVEIIGAGKQSSSGILSQFASCSVAWRQASGRHYVIAARIPDVQLFSPILIVLPILSRIESRGRAEFN